MASVAKFNRTAVRNELRHNAREIVNNSNTDIDKSLSGLNECLTPNRGMSEYEYYKQRISEVYVYNRADVVTMAGWVVTLPREIKEPEQQQKFFNAVHEFLQQRYGLENEVSCWIHRDEGIRQPVRSKLTGRIMHDENGKEIMELVHGQPHLHYCFTPVTDDKKRGGEKMCANDVLNRHELQHFHTDLDRWLRDHDVEGKVITGATIERGNYTVEELKTLSRAKEIERKHERERTIDRTERRN